ncbi:MAG: helix-turn-helix transcriptional regulator [Tenacibaculum sp.]
MISKRIKEIIENQNISVYSFEKKIGASEGVIRRAIKNNTDIQSKWLMLISNNYPDIDANWLLTGKGSMEKQKILMSENAKMKLIPLISFGTKTNFENKKVQFNKENILEKYKIPEFERKGVEYIIKINDSSMFPKYNNGDLLGCKPIKDTSFFQWGKTYVLDTNQGVLVKRLFPIKGNENLLECRSDNIENFPSFVIGKSSIYRISIVVGTLRME